MKQQKFTRQLCISKSTIGASIYDNYVKLIPDTYHDYMNHHEEGTVFQLPWEYECDGGDEAYFTVEQYKEIVALAQWEKEAKVKLA